MMKMISLNSIVRGNVRKFFYFFYIDFSSVKVYCRCIYLDNCINVKGFREFGYC